MDYVVVDDQPRLDWHCHRTVMQFEKWRSDNKQTYTKIETCKLQTLF